MNKSIGIITFHWASNHGAVLQTYASLEYMKNLYGVNSVAIINYIPQSFQHSLLYYVKPSKPTVMIERFRNYSKGRKLDYFRKKHLLLTDLYSSENELINNPPAFDIYLCGSDQIWNPSFTLLGEGKATGSYFLSFAPDDKIKASLSVSLGCDQYPQAAIQIAKPLISRLDYISVRENSGKSILNNMGFKNVNMVADPTSILSANQYRLLFNSSSQNKDVVALCILRNQSRNNRKLIRDILNHINERKIKNITYKSMEEWLSTIDNSKLVITNSFHCVMMSLKFHTPFLVIPEDGNRAGMNDRLITLLNYFGLLNRIVDSKKNGYIENEEIDWNYIDNRMIEYSASIKKFIDIVITDCHNE